MSEWWKKNNKKIPYNDSIFNRIFQFFVYDCPIQHKNGSKVSARAKTFEEAGIKDHTLTTMLSELKRKMNKDAKYGKVTDSLSIEITVSEIEKKRGRNEFLYIKPNSDLGETRSIFYYIRNSFAHGSFSIVTSGNQEKYYYFENERNGEIRGRFCISEKTLLKWVEYTNKKLKE